MQVFKCLRDFSVRARVVVAGLSVAVVFSAFSARFAHADVIADSNLMLLNANKAQKASPPLATRSLAIFHFAAHAAMEAKPSRALEVTLDEKRVRVLGALLEVAEFSFPESAQEILDWVSVNTPPNLPIETQRRAIALGRSHAKALLEERASDLITAKLEDSSSDEGNSSGYPIWVPPAGKKALHPHWGEVMPMVLTRGELPLLQIPNAPDSQMFLAELVETFLYGGSDSNLRSKYDSDSARLWALDGGTVTPPGQWNLIAQAFAKNLEMPLETESELFRALNAALFDASIACWRNKYLYRRARPDAAVIALFNASWVPFIGTPPHPEYPSGHSTFSAAAATVLEAFNAGRLEKIEVIFDGADHETRSYSSFMQAAKEAGMSRIYGGIHFEESDAGGQELGTQIAEKVLSKLVFSK